MWGCFVWYRRMTLLTKTRNFSLSIRPPFRAEKEMVKSLRELLKYKIKIENGNQFSDFFFLKEIIWANITRENCPKVTKWKSLMKWHAVFGGDSQNQRKWMMGHHPSICIIPMLNSTATVPFTPLNWPGNSETLRWVLFYL